MINENQHKELTLNSRFNEIERIESFVNGLKKWLDFNKDLEDKIMLVLSEAITNAIVHGNKKDPSKTVSVEARKSDNRLKLSVKDQGEGFDPSEIPDPLDRDNLLKEGGRGVFLIKHYADDISFSEGGTKLTIYFRLD